MPCTYEIFPEANLVLKSFTGKVTTPNVLDVLDKLEADSDLRPGMFELDDLRQVTDLAITATDIEKFADLICAIGRRNRLPTKKAIVAPTAAGRLAAAGFAEMVKDMPGIKVGVFDDFDDALAFLGFSSARGIRTGHSSGQILH